MSVQFGVNSKTHTRWSWSKFLTMTPTSREPSIKDVHTRVGRGVSQIRTHGDAGGRGPVAKSRRPQIQTFTEIFEVSIVSCVLENNICLDNKSFKFNYWRKI